jgi:hypothetical protein
MYVTCFIYVPIVESPVECVYQLVLGYAQGNGPVFDGLFKEDCVVERSREIDSKLFQTSATGRFSCVRNPF